MDSYYESAVGVMINRERALIELARHDCKDIDLFDAEVLPDVAGMYAASDVLAFLGY